MELLVLIVVTAVVMIIGCVTGWFEKWFGGLRDELVRRLKIRNDLMLAEARLKAAEADRAEAGRKAHSGGNSQGNPEEIPAFLRRQAD